MRIIKVTNVEQFAAKILPKQPQKNKTIVESILKDVKKNGAYRWADTVKWYAERRAESANLETLKTMRYGPYSSGWAGSYPGQCCS